MSGDSEIEVLSEYGRLQRAIEIAGIALFVALAAWNVYRLASSPETGPAMVVVAALSGWLAADLFSGLVHWGFDTWGSLRTPILGPAFIRPFREHHWDPQAMTRHDFVETNGASCFACLPALGAAALMPIDSTGWAWGHAILVATTLGVLATNQCHKWAHTEPHRLPAWVRAAQRLRLVLHPEDHRRHHTAPFDSHYCTTNGWLNAPFERVRLFRKLEWLVRQARGARH
jgi:ubiquitin-conjugating enzyme E2 variant